MAPAPAVTRQARDLGIVAVVAALLVAAVLWVGRRDYLEAPPALTSLVPHAVNRIELDIPPLTPEVFERRANRWWRVRPSKARADDTRVQRLARLAATPVTRWIPATSVAMAKLGLAHPSAMLIVNGVQLEYGGLTAIDHLRYVRVGDRIALVPRQYSPEVILTRRNTK